MFTKDDLSSELVKKKQFPAIDVAKMICALLVVSIHTQPLRDINLLINYAWSHYLASLAVPFFFITSGYFCFRKTAYENFEFKKVLDYVVKIIKLYIIWTLIYCIPFVYQNVFLDSEGYIQGVLSIFQTFVFSGYQHLWYLSALAFAVLLIALALKKGLSIKWILVVGICLYIIGLFGQSYFGLLRPLRAFPVVWNFFGAIKEIMITTRNGLFEGILFVSIGMLFAYKKIVMKYQYALLGFCAAMGGLLVEIGIVKYFDLYLEKNTYICLVPAAFFLFYLVSHIEIKESKLTKLSRKYSELIYLTHSWINFPIILIVNKMIGKSKGVEAYQIHSLIRFAVVLGLSFLVSWGILKLSEKEKFKWIKKLI